MPFLASTGRGGFDLGAELCREVVLAEMAHDGLKRGEPGFGIHGVLLHAAQDRESLTPVGERVVVPVGAVESGGKLASRAGSEGELKSVVVLDEGSGDIVGLRVGARQVEIARDRCGRVLKLRGEEVFSVGKRWGCGAGMRNGGEEIPKRLA